MSILSIIAAALPILSKLLDILTKTPEEKLGDIKTSLIKYMEDVSDGLKHLKENPGDTSKLDDALNKRR